MSAALLALAFLILPAAAAGARASSTEIFCDAMRATLESLDRGAFPYEGEGPAIVGGVYWEVEALAIAYAK